MDPVMLKHLVAVEPASHKATAVRDNVVLPSKPAKVAHGEFRTGSETFSSVEQSVISDFALSRSGTGDEESPRALDSPPEDAESIKPSAWNPYMNRYRLVAVWIALMGAGLFDGAAGAVIPYMEVYYDIGYAVVSLIFVGQAFGFLFAAIILDTLRSALGRARLFGLAQASAALAFIPLIVAAPFPVIVVSFFFVGFGVATNVAMANIFCGGLRNGTIILGCLHGFYGIGGTTGPLMATALTTLAKTSWGHYYAVTLGVCVISGALAVWSFWDYEKEQSLAAGANEQPDSARDALAGMFKSLQSRLVLLGAVFIFAYQGAEVSISGWVISFLIEARDGDPSSVGYVTSGFWAGITLGRFLLSPVAARIGEKNFVYGLTTGALAFQILVWFVPNIVGNAVAVSIVGLMLGPVYPCATAVMLRKMTKKEALSGLGTISASGSMGGAFAPFMTGLLAQAVETWVLHPIVIALFLVMLVCWYFLPSEDKKED